ncbi:ATP-dependent zinc metalloprotease FtsH [Deinococcus radiodurans]|jgi:membrane protease FtsH catalytic subunit (EC 3.4.24.-)|uniref:ATP-dependent zinc metalloprotease FtsH n=1 Tax=Deinococcus radiodurans (strain ATCC 13939 / DSM 20539 / JCM 16871 / CCUG 27074 / LMG 4051 / NBRC 15346 / NCIMB 9279 / VKM B-1422 / R1) TaxID=243230 RepID=Q9RWT2_DEIRA|nr:ATP-dependent zinc metalloprotease FtsH [Deinococcus radiodurans]AAF10160.1 cell division protein FtsH [Deinococcus radiodurans R1 = ATCC 13939 = DSM 20539]ANC72175.1 cell division protein FtsH [Deinococcus radiodurans R1 = ATCC 13939 = DSM 20539]QEM72530.1 ATP-dependent metallopeptidase FtsH/Yme1/Tma family protein [Deinococcus radiodurans]QIP28756.1 ATP-dependent metallopeptidase FtsH/Yme1/Tma family protein [Deinococcus radiodurans]QIP32539.1 ATP-dependent metallopeptidase FtsH/Yme1/Tma 
MKWWGWALLALTGGLLVLVLSGSPRSQSELNVNDFTQAVRTQQVKTADISFQNGTALVTGRLTSGLPYRARTLPADPVLKLGTLEGRGVTVTYLPPPRISVLGALSVLLTLALIGGLIALLVRSRNGGNNDAASSFGKSKAAIISEGQIKLTFADVAGCDEAKQDLQEVVEFLRQPEKYHQLGARIPRGVLLVGPPGSGKTLLAKAVAGEAKVPYFSISGSDFVEMFVGVGAARVRDLFEQARKASPCIVFIDEIDAVGRKRGMNIQGGNDEREQTLNQLLVEMDGFGSGQDVIILAATNRPDVLDAALLRPGRFDRQVVVDAPDVRGREQILRIHSRKKPLDVSVDLGVIARRTAGMVGADLENLLNEAALLAAREGRNRITGRDVDEARDRVLMGPERRSMVVREADRKVTAYHEVGHALVAQLLPHSDKAHKLTIVPRGRSLGSALYTPEDRMHHTRTALLDRICVALSGHAAEEVIYGEVTTGAQNDFQQATGLARRMVTEWGMSEVGQLALAQDNGNYLGFGPQPTNYSDHTAEQIDTAVADILNTQYARAHALLSEHVHVLHRLTDELVARESLSGDELQTVLNGGTLPELPAAVRPEGAPPPEGTLRPEGA